MGIVHAIQKGDAKASDYSKEIQAAVKSMKKKDVKDFADTDRGGLPNKVKKEIIAKLRELVRIELEGTCGYAPDGKLDVHNTDKLTPAGPHLLKKKKKNESVNEGINDKMKKIMTKLTKSLSIKSVVDMYTGKGSLSYFLDDEKEALKLQKFLQKSFKRVRKINLDKSKGDTANFVVAADMLGLESVEEERDYKAEYKKYGSSTKAKKYRAELNQYNRKKGTYGNGDGKDASHKGGKISGFEKESVNRGRAEKSRLKKEQKLIEGKFGKFDTGVGAKGNGLTMWDRNQSQGGDYKTIAHISDDGKLTIRDKNVKKEPKLMKALSIMVAAQKDYWRVVRRQFEGKLTEATEPLWTKETVKDAINQIKKGLKNAVPYLDDIGTGFGGESIIGKISLDPKKSWPNGYIENSRWALIHFFPNGTLDTIRMNGWGDYKTRKAVPILRKSKNKTIKQATDRMGRYFTVVRTKHPSGK